MNIEQDVTAIVARITKVPAARVSPDTHLKNELNVDSLQGLQIVAAIEAHFGITVPDEDLDSYASVREISQTVARIRSGADA